MACGSAEKTSCRADPSGHWCQGCDVDFRRTESRGWKQAGLGADHVLVNLEAKSAEDGIFMMCKHGLGRPDGCETLVGAISRILDHRTSLIFGELVWILLKAVDVQNFYRVDDAFLGHLNHREIVIIKNQVALVLEIRANWGFGRFTSGLVGNIQQVLFGICIDQALDGESRLLARVAAVERAQLKLPKTLVRLIERMGLGGSHYTVGDRVQSCHEMLMITVVKSGHGGTHEGSAGPEIYIGNVDVNDKAAGLKSKERAEILSSL